MGPNMNIYFGGLLFGAESIFLFLIMQSKSTTTVASGAEVEVEGGEGVIVCA